LGKICQQLGYKSRQAYYKAKKREIMEQELESEVLELVRTVRIEQRRSGVRKVYLDIEDELKSRGLKCGRDKLFEILNKHDMLIKPKKKYTKTTDSYHRFYKHKNKIKDLEITRPEQVWVSDITYIQIGEMKGYLFLITDAYSRKIMGWHLGYNMRVIDGLKALKMALSNRIYSSSLIHHSDRGIQYCADDYINYLGKHGIEPSMTEDQHVYESLQEAKKVVETSIRVYNEKRRHCSLHMVPPSFIHDNPIIEMKRWPSRRKYGKIA